ncbi:MAG: cysteine--tRNA ligase [Deltaproteobacteria bacterium]
MPQPFRIYNTRTRKVEDFLPLEAGKVGLYVCGMTVYDRAHVGHARAMVLFDTFVRYLRHRGWVVSFVRNFTDVDDKIISRAGQLGISAEQLARREIEAFERDVLALGLAAPSLEPTVTGSIDAIQRMITRLIDQGHAYEAEGNVWFAVDSFSRYGALSGQKPGELRSADAAAGKRHAADFALWKAAKPGEPAWESAWGAGRPGWHIECSAMAYEALGTTFDIHGGGLDLVFPHHENEVAQSECANGATYARYWMHNGLLTVAEGQKMGKSLGNVVNIEAVVQQFPAEAIRLYYLQDHYRSPLPWSEQSLPEALGMLSRLYDARDAAESIAGSKLASGSPAASSPAASSPAASSPAELDKLAKELGPDAQAVVEQARGFATRFYAALDDDFNTARALAEAFSLARALNRFAAHKKAKQRGAPIVAPALAAFELVSHSIGLLGSSAQELIEEVKDKRLSAFGLLRQEVEQKIAARQEHREQKRWSEADAIRKELEVQRIQIMDSPEGCRWRVALTSASE